jgi:hypothetical protein
MTPAALHAMLDVEDHANSKSSEGRPTALSPTTDLLALAEM